MTSRTRKGRGTPSVGGRPVRRALAFKIMADPHLGKLTYLRVYSGRLDAGSRSSIRPRAGRSGSSVHRMHANKREEIASVGAGHIVAVMGLKDTTTGEIVA